MKIVAFVVGTFMLSASCMQKESSGCTAQSPTVEEPVMINFATANNITYTKHSSGILYQIIDAGYGATPNSSSVITVYYVGKRMDGSVFDQTSGNPFTNSLSGLIEGWRIGLPLIKKGGKIRMIIPSALAYGCTGAGSDIAPNSPIYFEIQLLNVQ